ncbi:zinc-binding alcohol dehydrogenase family protein [Flagellimonas flava]|uniref:zinc-binding alcohol dehydrogenase family protein n=1 Tax=Flagellimonas flava TaxID=570519 RepID=UPI003D65D5E7
MHYIVCEKPGQFALKEKGVPVPKKNEALLKIKSVGICGTDLHAYAGNQAFFTYPRILGHELSAEVLEIGVNSKNIKVGDTVGVMPYLSCGKCIACINGKSNCCISINVLGVHTDGGMQEQIVVPSDILLPVGGLTDDEVTIIEPLAIAAHALRRAQIRSGETIAVMGCGPIGIGILKQAQIMGAKVIAMDINEGRLQYVKNTIGCDYAINASQDPLAKIEAITNGNLCTAVFDATGAKFPLEKGPEYMAHGGRFVLVGLSKGELTYNHPKIHAKEATIMCSRNATLEDFEQVINIMDQFPTASFVTHKVHYTEMIANFDHWLDPEYGTIKAVVHFNNK